MDYRTHSIIASHDYKEGQLDFNRDLFNLINQSMNETFRIMLNDEKDNIDK